MKTVMKTFRATSAESKRWEQALKQEGIYLADVCRAALDRAATRIEKKGAIDTQQNS